MKKIIVLSDGTGNSASALAKSNVWRTYQAIDLSQGAQIAQYGDGVGTSSIRYLAALGGAFGWGLKRNVLHLYKFLCRNYQPGDEIYGFGFSRGAFTIRVLIGLVVNQGLVRAHSEEELEMLANAAYREYRAERYRRGALSLSTYGRVVRNVVIAMQKRLLGLKKYTKTKNTPVESIKFLGLWDTVDAYGMPIKELKAGIDRFIWPLLFDSNSPSEKIERACHALALDDERATFHPLVWNVSGITNPGRFEQVWFPGMHADVGGGYHDDALSHVPLMWILDNAAKAGLVLKPTVVADYRVAATALGPMHDSREGFHSYYRYSPRLPEVLCAPAAPTIDSCVRDRIAHDGRKYAPISIPGLQAKQLDYEMAWDTVWWRRVVYWAMLAMTALLIGLAWVEWKIPATDPWVAKAVALLIDSAVGTRIDAVERMKASPTAVLIFLFAIAGCFLWGRLLAGRIADRAAEIWNQRPSSNQVIWCKQSMQRWRGISVSAVVAALGILAVAIHMQAPIIGPIAFVAATTAFALWRRRYDAKRLRQMKGGSGAGMRGWSLRIANRLRTSPSMIGLARVTSHHVIPFAFAVAVIAAAIWALIRLLHTIGV
jgi:uncharacterized protein (DUF2235 family)